jgi:hypothetical protein
MVSWSKESDIIKGVEDTWNAIQECWTDVQQACYQPHYSQIVEEFGKYLEMVYDDGNLVLKAASTLLKGWAEFEGMMQAIQTNVFDTHLPKHMSRLCKLLETFERWEQMHALL